MKPTQAELDELARGRAEARRRFIAAARGLDRGGKRGPGSHVSVTVESWDRLVLARIAYDVALQLEDEVVAKVRGEDEKSRG